MVSKDWQMQPLAFEALSFLWLMLGPQKMSHNLHMSPPWGFEPMMEVLHIMQQKKSTKYGRSHSQNEGKVLINHMGPSNKNGHKL